MTRSQSAQAFGTCLATRCLTPILYHPDYTVGSGITPDLLTFQTLKALAGCTAGGELHPALRTLRNYRSAAPNIGEGPGADK